MGSLKDTAYEKLDYLSQLTEIIVAPQNEFLAQLPDRYELTFEQLNVLKSTNWINGFHFFTNQVISTYLLPDNAVISDLTRISKCFQFEVSPDFQLDLLNKKLTGSVCLVKTTKQIEDKDILEFAIEDACMYLNQYNWKGKKVQEKIITILNTIEADRGNQWWSLIQKDTSSGRNIVRLGKEAIVTLIREIILENKWRIRDVKVIKKIGKWINEYIEDTKDTSSGLVNLVKLKIMVQKDLPIYSIDEV